jgi:hypothetical protein
VTPAGILASTVRREAEARGFDAETLERARDVVNIEQYERNGATWWKSFGPDIDPETPY